MSLTLTTSPVVEFSSAPSPVATSRYNAVHNPIIYRFQRKDYLITSIVVTGTTAKLTTTVQNDDIVVVGHYIYVSGNPGIPDGSYAVTAYVIGAGGFIEFTTSVAAGTYLGGFVILNTTRKSYRIEVQIGMMDTGTFVLLVTAAWVPNVAGVTDVDVAEYLKPQLPLTNAITYIAGFNLQDQNLSKIYAIKYREVWTGYTAEVFSAATTNDYIVNSAKQIGDLWGGNMAEFVPANLDVVAAKKAKFLSGFLTPHFWTAFPFDLSVIYSNVLALDVEREVTPVDINGTPGTTITTLLNPAGRYYVNRMLFTFYTYNYSAITETFGGNSFTIKLYIDGVLTTVGGGTPADIAAIVTILTAYLGTTAEAFFIPSTSIQIKAKGGHVYGDLQIINTTLVTTNNYPAAVTYVTPGSIYPAAYYLYMLLTYDNDFDITETKRIVLETGCTSQPVYLAWKSKNGAWDYWLFDWNQTLKRNVGDLKQYEKYITDFALATARIKVSSKTSVPSMVLGASNVPVDDVYLNEQYPGIMGLLESPEVLQLTNPSTWTVDGAKWRTVIPKSGSFKVLETRDHFSEVELEIMLPYLTLESQ